MSQGLYSGASGLALGAGLYKGNSGLWGGSSGLITGSGAALSLNFLAGAPLDPRITFSRGTQATLTGSTGKITYAPNNLLLDSQSFDGSGWAKLNCTASANTTAAPDGTLTADTLLDTAVSNIHYAVQNPASTVGNSTVIVSVYAKASTLNYVTVGVSDISVGTTYAVAVFNLANGTLSTTGASGSGYAVSATSITAVGNGWYRCSAVCVTGTASAFLRSAIGLNKTGVITASAGGMESYLGNGTGAVYVWGAQLEAVTYQTTPSTYVATTSSAYYGPRFDYDPVTLAPKGLLIEEQRTNLLLRSEEFDNSAWVKNAATIASNVTTAPDGTSTAEKLIADSGSLLTSSYARQPITKNASPTTYTSSIYAKAAEYNRIRFTVRDNSSGANNAAVTVSLVDGSIVSAAAATGTFSNASATVTSAGNGWYRIALSYTTGSETSIWGGTPFAADATATTGDGTSGIFIWGAQLEAGSFATSYIPTIASTVARSADVALMQGANFSNWYNQSEGAFVVGFALPSPTSRWAFTATDGTVNNYIGYDISSGGNGRWRVNVGGVAQANVTSAATISANQVVKAAGVYAVNSFQQALNGALATEDTSGSLPTVNQLSIGSLGLNTICGHIRSISYYNTRLPDATLQSLTA